LIRKIGKGEFGNVRLYQNLDTKEYIAVKEIIIHEESSEESSKESQKNNIMNEYKIMKELSHPNIIQVYDIEFKRR
jgi:serine/threonine protein kinase